MIYLIVGKSCTGKTQAREYLEKKFGLTGFEASTFLKEASRVHSVNSPDDLFKILGNDFVARQIAEKIPRNSDAVISGFRKGEELQHMKSLDKCAVIGLYAPDEICFNRFLQRRRGKDYKSFSDFYIKKICTDYALGLAGIMADYLDFFIDNASEDKNYLFASLNKIMATKNVKINTRKNQ